MKALILGTGSAQVDAIRYLKDAGWWVIGCSYRPEGPGLELVDQFELSDITDINRLESIGRHHHVSLTRQSRNQTGVIDYRLG
ncbi:hypothetical protein Thiowin_02749 [Thiorhodovibrio winogradskyi]|uniref:Uncharacterized protein n=1 Tax=Thiorhodovibrio winogradskyi TaxID=77007 RepID=A0ABZ0SDP3_9GAMM|nr:hypothetical protein [Thiorhodovibrio winogradskyi]